MTLKVKSLYFDEFELEKSLCSDVEIIDLESPIEIIDGKEEDLFIVKNFIKSCHFLTIKRYFYNLINKENCLSEFLRLIIFLTHNEEFFNIRAKFIKDFIISFLEKMKFKLLNNNPTFKDMKNYVEILYYIDSWKKSILRSNFYEIERSIFEERMKKILDIQKKQKKNIKNRKTYEKLLRKKEISKTTNYIITYFDDTDEEDGKIIQESQN